MSDENMQACLPDFLRSFARIGLLSFGGPAAQISLMHDELVERRRWMNEPQFLGALSFCMRSEEHTSELSHTMTSRMPSSA